MAALDSMPPFPLSVQRILKLTSEVSCAPKDLVEVIHSDPIVTVKVLRVVNSAYYSLPRQITSIDHAVVLLGFNTIKNLALSVAAVGMLPSNPLAGFDGQSYLRHSLATAGIARKIAAALTDADANEVFIAGLLHDFGKLVIAQVLPQEFRRALEMSIWNEISLHAALFEQVGIDDAQINAMLLTKWRFPVSLTEAIQQQHTMDDNSSSTVACIYAANLISNRSGVDFGDNFIPDEIPQAFERLLGGTLEHILVLLGDITPILDEARRFSVI